MRSVGMLRIDLLAYVTGLSVIVFGFDGDAQTIAPYNVGLQTAKLTTPQWVGEAGVDAVVVLSIDDMRETAKYETFLRPILDRLKKIDGRAPVSIFTNSIDPSELHLQEWLKEGLSLEVHTVDHPCPLLCDGDFAKAKSTYDRCVDTMSLIPNSKPVAFRMPCCDSLNTPSPRFWKEIFEEKTENSNYLAIDSSVFNIFTADDPDLDPKLTKNDKDEPRFRHYVPFKSFVNTIENYPYPYIIGDMCWEFPCVVPSDWEAQHVQKPNNPDTVRDLKRALDATVAKQGVMPIVFHPHGWIRSEQLVEFVDYAVEKYGKRVKFLNFAECLERINKNLLDGVPLRTDKGNEHHVRLVDVNGDGYLDVMRSSLGRLLTYIWSPEKQKYLASSTKVDFRNSVFVKLDGELGFLCDDEGMVSQYRMSEGKWHKHVFSVRTRGGSLRYSVKDIAAHDIDGDGNDELLVTQRSSKIVLKRQADRYHQVAYDFPPISFKRDGDVGVRLVDLNDDHRLDIVQANGREYGVWLFRDSEVGWKRVRSGLATDANAIPVIANPDGTNNGAWFHSNHLWVQNENTARLPDLVDRASYKELTSVKVDKAEGAAENPLGKAKSLEESLKMFELLEGCELEVVAAEPQIQDPIAFDWGPDGKLWVVEMSDYPNGANWHGPNDKKNDPGGRIKILEDKDNDGRFETSHLFLDGLHYPTGVKAWRGGAIISGAPNIIYAEDTDGDYKADVQRVLYSGLGEGNQQHRTNGLRWSPDLWLYMANGDSGGKVRSTKTGDEVKISGRDYRIQPDTGQIETLAGQTQFGRSRDEFGNWFGGNNSHPIWHYVLEEKYMRRNPHFAPPSARREIAEVPGAASVFPTSNTLERFNDFDRANKFTSACSPEIYRGRQASKVTGRSHNAVYVCEPVHNLVHRSEFMRLGPTFQSRRFAGEEQREFLTSSDNWFRPVMVRTGPDGTIWIADMYRMVIEHPEWIPRSWQDRIDHLAGNDKGRIYRVKLPGLYDDEKQAAIDREWQQIRKSSIIRLVHSLNHANGVIRDMAQQELYERDERKDTTTYLRKFYGDKPSSIEASNLLHHFGAFESPELKGTNAVWLPNLLRLIEPDVSNSPSLRDEVISLAKKNTWREQHWHASVAMQLAYTLGEIEDPKAGEALASIALSFVGNEDEEGTDKYVRAAVMSSVTAENCDVLMQCFLSGLAGKGYDGEESTSEFLDELTRSAVGYDAKVGIRKLIAFAISSPENLRRFSKPVSELLAALGKADKRLVDFVDAESVASLEQFAMEARQLVADQDTDLNDRLSMLRLFGNFESAQQIEQEVLVDLLSPREPQQLQRAAIERLTSSANASSIQAVLDRWSSFTPAIRDYVLSSSMRRTKWAAEIVDAIERGAILPRQVSLRHRHQLLTHKQDSIRAKSEQLFKRAESDRGAIVSKYREQEVSKPDLAKGKLVFAKQCSACHQLEGQGRAVGPDLTALSDKSKEAMLVAILDPNRAVEEKYLDYTVLTESGVAHRGILLDESATAITLATAEGETKSILRNEVEELQASGRSLMPVGLEQVLAAQDVADVTAYVQSISVPRKRFPGNIPQLAPVRDDGSIRLFAIHAEIYGPKIVLEEKYHNLGFWSDANDRAVWTIDAPKAGEYELVLDYACAPQQGKNRFQIRVNGEVLGGEVEFTDSWDTYRGKDVGIIRLPDEPVQLTIQSEGSINGFLMDLRTIMLYPQ